MSKKFPDEEWKKIPDHPNYSCSQYGRFKKHRKLVETKWDSRHEYKTICLDGKRYRAHRIVALTWIPNPDPEKYTVVDHINPKLGKDHNWAKNLRWVTVQQNTQYAVENNCRKGVRRGWIVAVNIESMEGTLYKTQKDAADALNIKQKQISAVLAGKKQQICGYKFFRLKEILGITEARDEEGSYGRTLEGAFGISTYNNVTMQITDERENNLDGRELRDICLDYLKNKFSEVGG